MTRCPSDEELERLSAGGLAGAEAQAVEAHVGTCAACQQSLDRLTGRADIRDRRGLSVRCEPGGDFLRRPEQGPPTGAGPSVRDDRQARGASTPGASRQRPLPGEPTGPYPGESEPPGAPPRRLQVALAAGPVPRSAGEVQLLLRKRLRVISLLFLVLCLVVAARLHIGALAVRGQPLPYSPLEIPSLWVPIGAFAALAGVLWGRRPIALVWLRAIEGSLFGLASVAYAANLYGNLRGWELLRCAPQGAEGMRMLARATSFGWLLLMILYGLYVPNTGRRSAAVVGAMALLLLAVGAAAGLGVTALPRELLSAFLGQLAFCLAVGTAIAVLGSTRIDRLRREALAARQLGQYRLKERLGAGGMGEVYLAEHVLLRRPCALKLIRPERAGDPKNLTRFEHEVHATATLTHPNTVEIFDYGHATDGTFYYVMEYLPGLSLEELVRRQGPLPPERAIHLLRQVCGALQEAHGIGLVHRDVKPSNVLVCQRGGLHDVVKLLDFGLVQVVASPGRAAGELRLTQEGAIAGTAAYMSPEQAAGRAYLDGRSDLYSLGAVAYFLLTGRPPFVRDTAVQTLAAHLGEEVVAPDRHRPGLPADLQAAVLRCLEKEPARRFPEAGALALALACCRSAGLWTVERAAAWWGAQAAGNAGASYPAERAEAAVRPRP